MKKKITIDKILETAVVKFMEKGYLGTSMREIAESVGVKAGSLYYHIRSKEELLERMHDFIIDNLLVESKKIISDNQITNIKKFELFATQLLRHIADYRPYFNVFFSDYRFLSPYYFKKINKKRKQYQEYLRKILRDGINEGEFQMTDIEMASIGIWGMFMWAHMWIDPKGRLKAEEIANIFCDTLFDGIRAAENRSMASNKKKKIIKNHR